MNNKLICISLCCLLNVYYCGNKDDKNITFDTNHTAIDSSLGLNWYLSVFDFSKKKSMPGYIDAYLYIIARGEYLHYYNIFSSSFDDLDFWHTENNQNKFKKVSIAKGGVGYSTGIGLYHFGKSQFDIGIDIGFIAGFHKDVVSTFEERACNMRQMIALSTEKTLGAFVRTCNLYRGNQNIAILNLLGVSRSYGMEGQNAGDNNANAFNRFVHNTVFGITIPNTDGYDLSVSAQIGGLFNASSNKKYHSFLKYLLRYQAFIPSIASALILESDLYFVFTGGDKNYFQQSVGFKIPWTKQHVFTGVNFKYQQPQQSYLFLKYTYDMHFDYNISKIRIYARGDYMIIDNKYRIGFGVNFNF